MSLPEEIEYYFCTKVGYEVLITLAVRSRQSSMDPNAKNDFVAKGVSDCDNAEQCGVKDEYGGYDWAQCEYLN